MPFRMTAEHAGELAIKSREIVLEFLAKTHPPGSNSNADNSSHQPAAESKKHK